MTQSLALDPDTGDLLLGDDGQLAVVDSTQSIADQILLRLQTFRGEWALDPDLGVDYYAYILGQKPKSATVALELTRAILTTPRVLRLAEGLLFDYNSATRTLSVSFTAITDAGRIEIDGAQILA